MIISLIAAASSNRVIGVQNQLPWHLPADLKFFKEKTLGHHILMGRKTWESFEKPLPGRTSVVISRNSDLNVPDGVFLFRELSEGIELARSRGESELMIIGGGQIFEEALPLAERLYLTHVYTRIPHGEGVILFPSVLQSEWKIVSSEGRSKDEKHAFGMDFLVLERKN
ncbi:MAG TPA: dihydrofolate reductase [Catalimonadaceae bacterium]|jgi:dihydrofolate reductase|nr:dihydrofolate reductase [Catalimonadaceae bacterium]HPI12474.1 dihydrofolate reductase [Catalimonadaceae bacterium]